MLRRMTSKEDHPSELTLTSPQPTGYFVATKPAANFNSTT